VCWSKGAYKGVLWIWSSVLRETRKWFRRFKVFSPFLNVSQCVPLANSMSRVSGFGRLGVFGTVFLFMATRRILLAALLDCLGTLIGVQTQTVHDFAFYNKWKLLIKTHDDVGYFFQCIFNVLFALSFQNVYAATVSFCFLFCPTSIGVTWRFDCQHHKNSTRKSHRILHKAQNDWKLECFFSGGTFFTGE